MFIVWLPFVNHILNYNLLTYLLTYLPMVTIVNRKGVSSGGIGILEFNVPPAGRREGGSIRGRAAAPGGTLQGGGI